MPAIRNVSTIAATGRWSRETDTRHYICRRCGGTRPKHQSKKRPDPAYCGDCQSVDPLYRTPRPRVGA